MGDPTVDPVTGHISPFMNSGDPLTNSGWLDSYCGDVDFMQGSGTFSMAPLDTQRVIYAVIIGHDTDRLSSIVDLRRNTHFVRSSFLTEFAVKVTANAETIYTSDTQTELIINSSVSSDLGISAVQAELYNYNDSLIQILDLYDDGMHFDGAANDNVFGNIWQTQPIDEPLYLNIKLTDGNLTDHHFNHAADKILLSNKIEITSFRIVDDNINNNLKMNPGENVRLNFGFANNYTFDFERINVFIKTNDPFVQIEPKLIYFENVYSTARIDLNYDSNIDSTFLAMDISPAITDTHTIQFDLIVNDNQYREWNNKVSLQIEPFDYVPNEIIPTHIAGKSDASFCVLVIDPSALIGHSYTITVSDSINEDREKGFNLIDQTMGNTILFNHPVPDKFAYNMPITDGFKIIKAVLPEGGLQDVFYENIEGGNPTGFMGIGFGGKYFNGGIVLGGVPIQDFVKIELEFTNRIDSSGVVGNPAGQGAFRYETTTSPTGFFPCPFNVWKIIHGEREGRLNACFQEVAFFKNINDTWDPDASSHGGMETLYIMSTDYDESGQLYQNKSIDVKETFYKIYLRLESESSVVDAGDKMIFDWEYPATNEDVFSFIPTKVKQENIDKPTSFALYQNYPNPFNPTTTIRFSVDKAALVRLKIYNIMGQEVIELFNKETNPGNYTIRWDGKSKVGQPVSSGIYFAKLISIGQIQTIKLLLIR